MSKPRVLTFLDYYLPGFKGGGPLRTLVNMIDRLGEEVKFRIVTLDRDLGDTAPYHGMAPGTWLSVGKAEAWYASPVRRKGNIASILADGEYDAVYLNSFFSPFFTIYPLVQRWLGRTQRVPFIVAPRGEFSPGALAIKPLRKRLFIALAKLFGLFEGVVWQASSSHEEADIRSVFGTRARVVIAPDLVPVAEGMATGSVRQPKVAGRLRALFLSRISPMKNLDGALAMLRGVHGEVEFDIYGPIEDRWYFERCQELIRELSLNIVVQYHGPVEHQNVYRIMANYDLFFFPTHGENFGHVIVEALMAGTPILISDQTPWRGLAAQSAGWDLSLDAPDAFLRVLEEVVDMDEAAHERWVTGAMLFGLACSADTQAVEQNRQLFGV